VCVCETVGSQKITSGQLSEFGAAVTKHIAIFCNKSRTYPDGTAKNLVTEIVAHTDKPPISQPKII
jgi:hypothetical protein